ncbi:MAG: universal stress protein UspA, partial [Mycobacterium sp.]|nr:universal stress protein UspA [Mycobacterium sp.]
FAEENESDLIVVGGARDGFFGGHVIGPVSSALLHRSTIPIALAPRGYADDAPERIEAITAAVPSEAGDDNPLPFAITLASAANLPIRMVSLVSAENLAEADDLKDLREIQISAARENLALAARALPESPDIESLVAEGMTLESALKKLNWEDTDVLVVGSSRFAAPKRIFLGSTASRILAGTDAPAPVIVIPRGEK